MPVATTFNSLTTKKQTTKYLSANFQKNVSSKLYYIENSKTRGQTVQILMRWLSVDLDEVAHYEPPHQDLHCLQIQLYYL